MLHDTGGQAAQHATLVCAAVEATIIVQQRIGARTARRRASCISRQRRIRIATKWCTATDNVANRRIARLTCARLIGVGCPLLDAAPLMDLPVGQDDPSVARVLLREALVVSTGLSVVSNDKLQALLADLSSNSTPDPYLQLEIEALGIALLRLSSHSDLCSWARQRAATVVLPFALRAVSGEAALEQFNDLIAWFELVEMRDEQTSEPRIAALRSQLRLRLEEAAADL